MKKLNVTDKEFLSFLATLNFKIKFYYFAP